jgi:surfeit locus 1 family protein
VIPRAPRSPIRLLGLVVLAALGTTLLLGLCVWQLERRVWKLDLIDRVTQRVHAPPAAAPGPALWPRISAAGDEYREVRVTGRFLNDRETLVKAVTGLGSGFWVLTPLVTPYGYTVLVNRGFVPEERRDPATRAAGQIGTETAVTGLLRMTEPRGAFLRLNQPQADRWYSRDIAAIAQARHLVDAAPYFIDADAKPVAGALPVGGLTVIAFPNNHLLYAMTWLALALLLAGGAVQAGREEWQLRRQIKSSGRLEAALRP